MDCCAVGSKTKQSMSVIKENKVRNEYVRQCIGVYPIIDEMRENRLKACFKVERDSSNGCSKVDIC